MNTNVFFAYGLVCLSSCYVHMNNASEQYKTWPKLDFKSFCSQDFHFRSCGWREKDVCFQGTFRFNTTNEIAFNKELVWAQMRGLLHPLPVTHDSFYPSLLYLTLLLFKNLIYQLSVNWMSRRFFLFIVKRHLMNIHFILTILVWNETSEKKLIFFPAITQYKRAFKIASNACALKSLFP